MMELYSKKACELSKSSSNDEIVAGISYLNTKEKKLLLYLIKNRLYDFTPIEVAKKLGVTNKTIINRCAKLTKCGFLIPNIVKERIRSYSLSEYAKKNHKQIISIINSD